ncbi:glycosyltransferase [Polaribacter sp.]|uniref:glycosyltransferase n=1 Tax=Polaribacter sp. TaxID=1920175 RepID=UPI003F6A95C1
MNKLIISVTNDLHTDQRVAKVCNTLHNNGYEIILVGRKLKDSKNIHRNYKTKRFKLLFNQGFLFYFEFNFRLFLFLLFSKKNMLLANDLDTLLPNFLISKLQAKKLIFDSHELFSEIPELVHKPRIKSFWVSLENWILPKLKNNYTVCNSIANYYKEKYKVHFKTIKNLPFKKDLKKGRFDFDTKNKKVILYQGAVNIGRGLELIIDSMHFLENHLLVIIGNGDIYKDLQQKVSLEKLDKKVFFLGKKSPEKLQLLTPLADIGISLEEDLGLNYRFVLPNKIFDYIQAEVPVLVANLPEMKQVVADHNVGEIVFNREPKIVAKQIRGMLEKDYSKALKNAKEELIWQQQEAKLLSIFKNAK